MCFPKGTQEQKATDLAPETCEHSESSGLHHLNAIKLNELGLDSQRIHKTALKMHAHLFIRLTNQLQHDFKKSSEGLGLEQGAASHPPDPH